MRGDDCGDRDSLRLKDPSSYSFVVPQSLEHELEHGGRGQFLLETELQPQQDSGAART